jgi:hypothetical protein
MLRKSTIALFAAVAVIAVTAVLIAGGGGTSHHASAAPLPANDGSQHPGHRP